MDWLNYHHFMYFWVVAREGSIVKASEVLMLAQPTISGQIHSLEEALGVKLFTKRGRQLVLTEAGQLAYRYAEEIFPLGHEFVESVQGRANQRNLRLLVGVANALPSPLVRRFVEPARELNNGIQICCYADRSLEDFVAELVLFRLDVILADRPADPTHSTRVFSHLLGECETTFFATSELARKLRRKFPDSLDGTPFLMPGAVSAVRLPLDEWFRTIGVAPRVVMECDDGALSQELGSKGTGVFMAPSVIEAEVKNQFRVGVVGRTDAVRHHFYAISVERKIRHPAVKSISEAAQDAVFSKS